MFCLILTVLILKKLMCQFEMLFALLTYLFLSVKKQKEVLLFPNFQRSFGFTPDRVRRLPATRFFERSAKVRDQLLLPKFLSNNFRCFWCDIQFVLWRTVRFLITGSKDKGCDITTKLFYYFSLFLSPYPFTNFRELICRFIRTGGEDRAVFFSTKSFLK